MNTCVCGKEIETPGLNYCTWQCQIDSAKASGYTVHTPNGLPIRCIKGDGSMLEHEHGDHPDYKHPVEIEYYGPIDDDLRHDYEMMAGKAPESDDDVRSLFGETHALIYTDGYIAVTLYECCYAMWSVRDGKCLGGKFVKPETHRLVIQEEDAK
jgi:hypothetical protein